MQARSKHAATDEIETARANMKRLRLVLWCLCYPVLVSHPREPISAISWIWIGRHHATCDLKGRTCPDYEGALLHFVEAMLVWFQGLICQFCA